MPGILSFLACGVLMGFTITLGIHVALRAETSRLAVSHSLGTIFFLSVGTLICIYLILISGRFETQWLSFVVFILAGWGGLWWVLNGNRPSAALSLASALRKIDAYVKQTPPATLSPSQAHLFIMNPFAGKRTGMMLSNLFSTHPPTEQRVARLEHLRQEMRQKGEVVR